MPRILPALIPMPALCATYLPISPYQSSKMLSRVSSTSTRTQVQQLSKWSSHSCHDRCGNVDFVLADCVVVSSDIVESRLFGVLCKYSQGNHDIHELWSFIYSTTTTILYQILINYLAQSCIGEQKVTTVIYETIYLFNLFFRVFRKISLSYTCIFTQFMM